MLTADVLTFCIESSRSMQKEVGGPHDGLPRRLVVIRHATVVLACARAA
jgi:hypothetical protein